MNEVSVGACSHSCSSPNHGPFLPFALRQPHSLEPSCPPRGPFPRFWAWWDMNTAWLCMVSAQTTGKAAPSTSSVWHFVVLQPMSINVCDWGDPGFWGSRTGTEAHLSPPRWQSPWEQQRAVKCSCSAYTDCPVELNEA